MKDALLGSRAGEFEAQLCPGGFLAQSARGSKEANALAASDASIEPEKKNSALLRNAMMMGQANLCHVCNQHPATVYCTNDEIDFCDVCNEQQHVLVFARRHNRVPIDSKPTKAVKCRTHPQDDVRLYCSTDQEPICVVCGQFGKHKGHNVDAIENLVDRCRVRLNEQLTLLRDAHETGTRRQGRQPCLRDAGRVDGAECGADQGALRTAAATPACARSRSHAIGQSQ